ncbi:MAG: sodium:pantothenate symporter, partial [Gammaproteobacteria bacterium]
IHELDADNVRLFNPNSLVAGSWWAVFAIWFAHVPLGMLPHIGNKLWALDDPSSRRKFLTITFVLGVIMPALALGGLLARAVVGDQLLAPGQNPNNAIPVLFVTLLPAWAAALLGAGVLAAVMSTADGLAISASQIFANDIYRRTLARDQPAATVDRNALIISRIATAVILILGVAMAWALRETNIAIIVWLGIGGLTAALTGPLVLGAIWSGVTRAAAIAGFLSGAAVFAGASLIAALISSQQLDYGDWNIQFLNPFVRATIGGSASAIVTIGVSFITERLPNSHVARLFSGPS